MRGQNKYKAKKITIDGFTFDSKHEAQRWLQLIKLQEAGIISGLDRQIKFELIPMQQVNGVTVERSCNYVADFVYKLDGELVIEDAKSAITRKNPEYVIKRKLMLERYGIQIKEV